MAEPKTSPWLEIPIPPSANQLWRVARRRGRGKARVIPTVKYAEWLKVAVPLIKRSMPKAAIFPIKITIEVTGGKGWRQGRDISNAIKATEDAIKHAGIIPDDNTDYVVEVNAIYFEPMKPKQQARCLIKHGPCGE